MKITILIFKGILIMTILLTVLSCARKGETELNRIPDWAEGYPLYEVYVRAFSPEGTFKALEARLPELKQYGIKNIWLMPVHPIGEKGRKGTLGCPYSVKDYFTVNPEYGSEMDLIELINKAHSLDMRIILDMVLNHCANDQVEMEKHPEWFAHDSLGAFTREVADWSDVTDWDFTNQGTRDYLDKALTYWVRRFDVDGFRCDVAGMIPSDFWRSEIEKLKILKPEIFMLAEWETPGMHQIGFDATYDWNMYHRMVLHREGEISLDSLWEAVEWRMKEYPKGAISLEFIENHDQERSLAVFCEEYYKSYAALIFTLPGIPLLYNGQEIGTEDRPSLFEKEGIEWNKVKVEVKRYYQQLLKMRNKSKTLRTGDLARVAVEPREKILAFIRSIKGETVLVTINFTEEALKADFSTEFLGRYPEGKLEYSSSGEEAEEEIMDLSRGIELEGFGYKILAFD